MIHQEKNIRPGRRLPQIAEARNDILVDVDGRRLIDLFSANGTAWLGHCDRAIASAIADQLNRVWITGGLATAALSDADSAIESFFPESYSVARLLSTGMEAAEFAVRIARRVTNRNELVGFDRNMHGKSMAMARLGWDNGASSSLPEFHRLRHIPERTEEQVLNELEKTLNRRTVSAVFVEPIQGSGGGHMPTPTFHREVVRMCREFGALSVFDEILTGFHRTGKTFLFEEFEVRPDIVLIGKAMGNGFPVSGVVVREGLTITPNMLPGSTFSGNALAATAVHATLTRLRTLDAPAMVAVIEKTICDVLRDLPNHGIAFRGKGAMWVLELPTNVGAEQIATACYHRGVLLNFTGRFLRVIPALTIEPANLLAGCDILRQELIKATDDASPSTNTALHRLQ